MGAHYSIQIPTKPYLKKYIESLYGTPTVFSIDNYFGMTVCGFLARKFFFRQNEEVVHKAFDKFNDQLQMYFPRWWMSQSHFGTDIPPQNVIFINKLFEERFEEDLSKYCLLMDLCQVEIKKALEEFCRLHSIEIDQHITFEALKKKEYRTRKNFSENYIANLSRQKSRLVQGMTF
jgi:hypothetical protein